MCIMLIAIIMFIVNAFTLVSLTYGAVPDKGDNSVVLLSALEEAVEFNLNIGTPDPSLLTRDDVEGKIVYITGPIVVQKPAVDPKFQISIKNTLIFSRDIQRYQTIETSIEDSFPEPGVSRKFTYHYQPQWTNTYVDSSLFFSKDPQTANPTDTEWLKEKMVFYADASIGNFGFSQSLLQQIEKEADWHLVPNDILRATVSLLSSGSNGNSVLIGGGSGGAKNRKKLVQDYRGPYILIQDQIRGTEVGDLRYSFMILPAPDTVSILARVQQGLLVPIQKSRPNGREKYEIMIFSDKGSSLQETKTKLEKKVRDDTEKGLHDASQYMLVSILYFLISCCLFGIFDGCR